MYEKLKTYNSLYSVDERKQLIRESLQNFRLSKGLKQKEVAELIGINYQTYCNYESGRCEPPAEYLVRLALLYEIPVDLLVQTGNMNKNEQSQQELIETYRQEIEEIKQKMKDSPSEMNYAFNSMITEIEKLISAIENK